jgi:hypothetical protein
VPGGEPADLLGEAEIVQQLMTEYAVLDVVDRVQFTGRGVEAVDTDVVQEGAGPDQVAVDVEPGEQLLGDPADQLTVHVHGFEGFAGRRVIAMQSLDLAVGGDLHQPVRWSWSAGAKRSIRVARSIDATGSSPTR